MGIEKAGLESLKWPYSKPIIAKRAPNKLQTSTGWGAVLGGSWAELAVGGDYKMHLVVLGTGSALPRIQAV